MILRFTFSILMSLAAIFPLAIVHAAHPSAGKPTIRLVSPSNGATIHGSTVSVRVEVSNFKLVKPVLVSPAQWNAIPKLQGNQGHIHYVLDSMANLVLTQDVVVNTSHTWTNVSPGRHTVTAYLATSQHAPFPGVQAARITINVVSGATRHAVHAMGPVPSIQFQGYQMKRTRQGVIVVAQVHVSNFKLVAPIYKNPPLRSGNQGHIHYVLDTMANFVATRDAKAMLSHPWNNVSPGHHTIIAFLSNTQHQLFPGTKPALLRINVPAAPGNHTKIGLRTVLLPVTGGAAWNAVSSANAAGSIWVVLVCLAGVILMLVGLIQMRNSRAK